MTVTSLELRQLPPETLVRLHERLKLIGLILGQLALLEVVTTPGAAATAKAQAAKTLTLLGDDPHSIAERLEQSTLATKSPEELIQLVEKLRKDEIPITALLEENE